MLLILDAGERDDETEELWLLFDLLNCACGGHAGDQASMRRVAAFCARTGTRLGAHPSYPDRAGFGRRSRLALTMGSPDSADGRRVFPSEIDNLYESVAQQCRALATVARGHSVVVSAVKLHGALYHDATASVEIADAAFRGAADALGTACLVIGPAHGAQRVAAERLGLTYAREGFADRRTHADGSLVDRTEPGALITDPQLAAQHARRLVPDVDILCVHSDTPHVIAIARAVRGALRG